MRYRMPLNNKELRVRKLLDILGCMKPFSDLADRERDVFAEYLNGYLDLKTEVKDDEKIFKILFEYDFTKKISYKLSDLTGKQISMDIVRNYATKLRKKGFLGKKSISKKFLFLFNGIGNEITFEIQTKE